MWRFIAKNSAAINGGATKTRTSAALKGGATKTRRSAAINGGATKTRRSAAIKGRAAMSVVILAMGLVVIFVVGLGFGAPVFAQKTGGGRQVSLGRGVALTGRRGEARQD